MRNEQGFLLKLAKIIPLHIINIQSIHIIYYYVQAAVLVLAKRKLI